jgi:hypothetical protein
MTDLSSLVAAAGPSSAAYRDPVFPDRTLILHAARPNAWHPGIPVLFIHHGVTRNGQDYRDYWQPHVDPGGFLAISIEFPNADFPDHLCYNLGNLRSATGELNPRSQWTFGVDGRLFVALRNQGITTTSRHGLFGHSAGGQFVHRMLSLGYRDHVAVAIGANAGTYAMPDLATNWPWGLGATDLRGDDLPAMLAFPLIILAGTEDTRTTGRFFPKGAQSLRQGPTRYARAHAYHRAGQAAAAALGVPLAWRLIDVPGVGHNGRRMSDAAAPLVAAALRQQRQPLD